MFSPAPGRAGCWWPNSRPMKTFTCLYKDLTTGRASAGTISVGNFRSSDTAQELSCRLSPRCCCWWLRLCTFIPRPTPFCAMSLLQFRGLLSASTSTGGKLSRRFSVKGQLRQLTSRESLFPGTQQSSEIHDLRHVVRIVIGNQQRFPENCLPISPWKICEQVCFWVRNQLFHRFQVLANLPHRFVPRRG